MTIKFSKIALYIGILIMIIVLSSCNSRKSTAKKRYKKVRDCGCSKFSENKHILNDDTYQLI